MGESQLGEHGPKITREIVVSVKDLPPLDKENVRVVRITSPQEAERALKIGFNYEHYGIAASMARAWADSNDVEYGSDDPRFNKPGLKAVIMDMTNDEWRLHNNVVQAPGSIPSEKIVGIVDAVFRPKNQ